MMARVAFSRQGMELFAENINGPYMIGDPLPVALINAGQKAWAKNMGYGDDASHIQPGSTWETVRVGAQSFSYKQFLEARKTFDPTAQRDQLTDTKRDNTPRIIKGTDAPTSWSLAADIMLPTSASAKPDWQQPGPVITGNGEVDWSATQEDNIKRDLAKLGAKLRPPKPDGF